MKAIGCLCFSSGSKDDEHTETKASLSQSNTNTSKDSSFFKSENASVSGTSVDSLPRAGPSSLQLRTRQNLRVFTFSEMKDATNNFSRSLFIGEGGFGCVYKGMVKSSNKNNKRVEVAIKQLGNRGSQGHKEWLAEVNVFGVVEHPNLVKLLGYCAEDDERGIQRLLVYEFMPNKSVSDHLTTKLVKPLSWSQRLRIALDSAQCLAYLHEEMEFQIIFRDFKTSNILLDDQWNAKLSDFGLAREGPAPGESHVSTAVVGTVGYASPEYIETGHLTVKSDIWSYGVVLYELLTGRRPIDRNRPKSEQKLLEWARPFVSNSNPRKLQMIMDPRLAGMYDLKSALELAGVADKCLIKNPKDRPKMSDVSKMVKEIVEKSDLRANQGSSTVHDSRQAASSELNGRWRA